MDLHFVNKSFEELTLNELYDILTLRQEIFVVEQNCPYLDNDGKDQAAVHIFGINAQKEIMAYTRILPKGISYPKYAAIGRVVTHQKIRKMGFGRQLMIESIQHCQKLYPDVSIKISAQVYILDFYKSLGFVPVGDSYLEDNIPHQAMILK